MGVIAPSEDEEPTTITGVMLAPLIGVSFERLPESLSAPGDIRVLQREAARAEFGEWADVPETDNQTLSSATHVVELGNVTLLAWPHASRLQPTEESSSRLDDFMAMLSLSAGGFVGYAEAALMPSANAGESAVYSYLLRDFASRLDAASRFGSNEMSTEQLSASIDRWRKLPTRHPSLRTAAQRLLDAWLRAPDSHDQIVDFCIGIEALVGEGANELVNRISLRSAAMLATAGWQPSSETAQGIRDIYSYRSQVVHGVPAPYKKEMIAMGGGPPMHAVRFALAVLMGLLELYFADEDLSPTQIDERFIFSAFDARASLECH